MTFVDTSAAARLLVADVGSPDVLELFGSDAELYGSALLTAELLRVATRNRLGWSAAERILRRIRLLAIDDSLLREAGRLDPPGAWVRTADALPLVSASRLGEVDFVTYDRVQARAAEALGFAVHSPGMPGRWWT